MYTHVQLSGLIRLVVLSCPDCLLSHASPFIIPDACHISALIHCDSFSVCTVGWLVSWLVASWIDSGARPCIWCLFANAVLERLPLRVVYSLAFYFLAAVL